MRYMPHNPTPPKPTSSANTTPMAPSIRRRMVNSLIDEIIFIRSPAPAPNTTGHD